MPVWATMTYGHDLIAQEFSGQTDWWSSSLADGDDNASTFKAADVKKALTEAVSQETLESLVTILIGSWNVTDPHMGSRAVAVPDRGWSFWTQLHVRDRE